MTTIAVTSTRSSPGASSLAVGLAFVWNQLSSEPLLVEADPSGGVIGLRFDLSAEPSLATLSAAMRRGFDERMIEENSLDLHGARCVLAPTDPLMAHRVLERNANTMAAGLAGLDRPVVIDIGRLTEHSPALPLARAADLVLLVSRPLAEDVQSLLYGIRLLRSHGCAVALVLVGNRPFQPTEVASLAGVPLAAVLPDERALARALVGGMYVPRRLRRSMLWRSITSLAKQLLVTAHPVTAPDQPIPPPPTPSRPETASSEPASPPPPAPPPSPATIGTGVGVPPPPRSGPDHERSPTPFEPGSYTDHDAVEPATYTDHDLPEPVTYTDHDHDFADPVSYAADDEDDEWSTDAEHDPADGVIYGSDDEDDEWLTDAEHGHDPLEQVTFAADVVASREAAPSPVDPTVVSGPLETEPRTTASLAVATALAVSSGTSPADIRRQASRGVHRNGADSWIGPTVLTETPARDPQPEVPSADWEPPKWPPPVRPTGEAEAADGGEDR